MAVTLPKQDQSEQILAADHPILIQYNNYCDSCTSARATHRVWIDRYRLTDEGPKSLDVILCGHHFHRHEEVIIEAGYETELI